MIFITNSSINSSYNLWLDPESGTIHTEHIPSGEFNDYPEVLTVWSKDEIPF